MVITTHLRTCIYKQLLLRKNVISVLVTHTCMFVISKIIVLIDFSPTVKAATLIFIPGRCSAIASAKQGQSGSI